MSPHRTIAEQTNQPRLKRSTGRPPKLRKDFPLSPHPRGYWCKKIKGKIYYFGRWGYLKDGVMERIEGDGWEDAKRLYDAQIDDLTAGRRPKSQPGPAQRQRRG